MKALLALPSIYKIFTSLVGGNILKTFADDYIKAKNGNKILDIGCGTANILEYLPKVKYTGFDISQKYIDAAIKKYAEKGFFFCKEVTKGVIKEKEFDIILALGVLHHLNDRECAELYDLAQNSLKQNGRLITIDACYVETQSIFEKYIISIDRGKYIRTIKEYLALANIKFYDVNIHIRHDLIRIPYCHIIMECTK